jgi:hypothetical protein
MLDLPPRMRARAPASQRITGSFQVSEKLLISGAEQPGSEIWLL